MSLQQDLRTSCPFLAAHFISVGPTEGTATVDVWRRPTTLLYRCLCFNIKSCRYVSFVFFYVHFFVVKLNFLPDFFPVVVGFRNGFAFPRLTLCLLARAFY
jgi:hypothetical protein